MSQASARTETYTRYPLSSILIYNGVTFLHFVLGGIGIIIGYNASWLAYLLGLLYLVFAFGQMYIIMPLKVCPNCVYYRLENARCTTALNLLAQKIAPAGNPADFPGRAQGLLCHNNLYMAALVIPIIAMLPALIWNFSVLLLALFLGVDGLLLFRFFVIFSRIACVHCKARSECPNAQSMGLQDT